MNKKRISHKVQKINQRVQEILKGSNHRTRKHEKKIHEQKITTRTEQ